MLSRWQRTLMAVALGISATSGLVRAQERPVQPVSGVMTEVYEDGANDAGRRKLVGRSRAAESRPTLVDKWHNRTPIGCYGHFNDFAVGSFCSEFSFLFGGARTFYGERCLKGPPPSPVPGFDPAALNLILPGGGVGFGLKHDKNQPGSGFLGLGCINCR